MATRATNEGSSGNGATMLSYQSLQEENQKLRQENSGLQERVTNLTTEVTSLRSELIEVRRSNESMQQANERMQKSNERMEKHLQEVLVALRALVVENQKLRTQNREISARLDNFNHDIEVIKRNGNDQIESLQNEVNELKARQEPNGCCDAIGNCFVTLGKGIAYTFGCAKRPTNNELQGIRV